MLLAACDGDVETSSPTSECGNGVREAGESCDGADLGGATCQSQGFTGGQLACGVQCAFDLSGCYECGNDDCETDAGETAANCPADCDGWVALSPDLMGTYGLRADGTLWSWGYSLPFPEQVLTELAPLVQVASRMAHACAVDTTYQPHCWGDNGYGNLGDGTTDDSTAPVQPSGLAGVTAVGTGDAHSCAARSDGTVWCWGGNERGQLGDGTGNDSPLPVAVSSLTGVLFIAAGGEHSCAILVDGSAYCWGANDTGQLGDGTTTDQLGPVPVMALQ